MRQTHKRIFLKIVLACSLYSASGCVFAEVEQLRRDHDEYSQRTNTILASLVSSRDDYGNRLALVEQSVRMLACGPELRSLFSNIEAACRATQNCSKSQLSTPMASFEDDSREDLGQTLMTTMRHEVVYPAYKGVFSELRKDRLDVFSKEAVKSQLGGTRYLLVTAPIPNEEEARQRAVRVHDELVQQGLPKEKFENPWIYRLFKQDVQWRKFRPVDQPVQAELKDLSRAVFVFRVSC